MFKPFQIFRINVSIARFLFTYTSCLRDVLEKPGSFRTPLSKPGAFHPEDQFVRLNVNTRREAGL